MLFSYRQLHGWTEYTVGGFTHNFAFISHEIVGYYV